MIIENWILPLLIGFVSAVLLISILYNNNRIKQAFTDIGGLIQLQNSSIFNTPIWIPLDSNCNMNNNSMNNNNQFQKITNTISPLYTDDNKGQPIYNYYPKTPVV